MRRPFFTQRSPSLRRVNEQIRLTPVRVIDHTGDMLGEIPTAEALRRAREAGLDLVEVDPNARPPVCKIMDYGKHKYQESKRKQTKHKENILKEIRIRPKTDPHDKLVKVNRARDFLTKGFKVQFTMMFRGRERAHPQVALAIFDGILEEINDIAKLERASKFEGRRMTMVVMPLLAPPPKPAAKPAKPKPQAKSQTPERPADAPAPPDQTQAQPDQTPAAAEPTPAPSA